MTMSRQNWKAKQKRKKKISATPAFACTLMCARARRVSERFHFNGKKRGKTSVDNLAQKSETFTEIFQTFEQENEKSKLFVSYIETEYRKTVKTLGMPIFSIHLDTRELRK
jgi:hypothetical protein